MGNVVSAGARPEPGAPGGARRRAPRRASRPSTINKVCGSGLKAVMLAAQAIEAGDSRHRRRRRHGVDEPTRPYLLPAAREGLRLGHGKVVDSMIHDGLWCAVRRLPHGDDRRARRREVPRQPRGPGRLRRRTATARRPRARARAAPSRDEILPVDDPAAGRATPTVVDRDESVRADTTPESLGALKPAFDKDGTVTAGNAPGVNDGAAALVVMARRRRARARPDAARARSSARRPAASSRSG